MLGRLPGPFKSRYRLLCCIQAAENFDALCAQISVQLFKLVGHIVYAGAKAHQAIAILCGSLVVAIEAKHQARSRGPQHSCSDLYHVPFDLYPSWRTKIKATKTTSTDGWGTSSAWA